MRHRTAIPSPIGIVLLALCSSIAAGCSSAASPEPTASTQPSATLTVQPTPTPEPTVADGASALPATPRPSPSPAVTPRVTAAATASPTAAPTASTASIKAYLLLEDPTGESSPRLTPVYREIEPTAAVGRAAMTELLRGPTEDDQARASGPWILGSAVHPETRLLDLDVAGGTATVDLSTEFLPLDLDEGSTEFFVLGLAQVTYTLTQFPTVDRVAFRVEGEPFRPLEGHEGSPVDHAVRDAYLDQLGPIFIDEPAWGAPVQPSMTISGRAQILDAAFEVAIVDAESGELLVSRTVVVECGEAGCTLPGGGEFSVDLEITAGTAGRELLLRAWDPPAAGDAPVLVEYPLR